MEKIDTQAKLEEIGTTFPEASKNLQIISNKMLTEVLGRNMEAMAQTASESAGRNMN